MKYLLDKIKKILSVDRAIISGLNEGEKAFFPSFFSGKVVLITPNPDNLMVYQDTLKSMGKRVVTIDDKLPFIINNREVTSRQYRDYILSLNMLSKGEFDVVLLTPPALFQKLPNKDYFLSRFLKFAVGGKINLKETIASLVTMGYVSQDLVGEKGDYSIRGDLLDIFPVNSEYPVRISLFDDEIESIDYFDLTNYRMKDSAKDVSIFCNSLLSVEEDKKQEIEDKIKKDLSKLSLSSESMIRVSEIVNRQLEFLEQNMSTKSSVFFLPYLDYFDSSILDYINDGATIIFDEPKLIDDRLETINDDNVSTFLDLSLKGEFLPKHMDFYFQKKDILKDLSRFKLLSYARLISQNKFFKADEVYNFICPSVPKFVGHFIDLASSLKDYLKNDYSIALIYDNDLTLKKIVNVLESDNLLYSIEESINTINKDKITLIKDGMVSSVHFEMEKLLLLGKGSLNAHIESVASNKLKEEIKEKFLPKVGEYVVHEVHGVGKCLGIKNIKITSTYRDYIVIEYKGGDLLYLPSENANLLSPFQSEGEVKCNKIGGTDFFKVKQKVKSSIKEMAFDLIKVYSDRMNSKGNVYSKDTYLQQAFEDAFSYPYTDDQRQAISDIKKDMESPRIMDRLVCGDVGFGKTEVALCGAFKAIQDGKQVAIICPTTILSEQHFSTAKSRMKDFFVNVEVLNRFKTPKEQKQILEKLASGEINLICGTHRLLSQDVKFKDLGLIIIDEEQRFGVEDKEKLKNIKRTVDVLSLSATPIPRTLYMALSGIRDVSYLTTAPRQRKKIKTAVIDYSDALLVNACKAELNRDGQVLIVYNRVDSIANFYHHVKNLLPDVNIGYAHGQMDSKTLENAIYDLYSRKTQILISTVLIENGIDLPHANTLFVIDADKLGLSQLYQLRGRIGRSDIEAFAYFSFQKDKVLTIDSYKRLDAIMEFSDLGSGYMVAMRDMQIRGAGDVLGRSQHGHMQQVGYDMYVKLLSEVVKEIRGEKVVVAKDIKIDISISAFVPDEYISSSENRIMLYTSVSKLSSFPDLEKLVENTTTKYGPLPKSVKQLFFVGLTKNLAQNILCSKVVLNEFNCHLDFYDDIKDDSLFPVLKAGGTLFTLSDIAGKISVTIKSENDVHKTQENLLSVLQLLNEKK